MEQIILNLVPGGVSPVCYVSQYDVGRKIRLHLRNGSDPYVLSGAETVTATIRKVSGEELIYDIANTSASYVDLIVNYDATDVIGESVCELIITESGIRLGSANFKMRIDPDVYSGDQKLEVVSATSENPNISFETNVEENLLELKAGFSPVQDLHGYDSPWIDSNVVNKKPYLLRAIAGTASRIGTHEYNKIVGGTVAFNQLVSTQNVSGSQTAANVIFTKNNNGSYTISGTANGRVQTTNVFDRFYVISGHKYFIGISKPIAPLRLREGNSAFSLVNTSSIMACTTGANAYLFFDSTTDISGTSFDISNVFVNIIDLTAMFGSTIADYIYSLEQATAGAGVAWFKALFPKDYYAYNAGELISVKTSAHNMIGFNQFDEVMELGGLDETTGNPFPLNTALRSKNFIPCIPDTNYYYRCGTSGLMFRICYYNKAQNFISAVTITAMNNSYQTPSNCYYIKIGMRNTYGTTYRNDICINISDSNRNGEYKPYIAHSYPLDSDLELRGIPKLDANNNLLYDGDEYTSDGNVLRKIKRFNCATDGFSLTKNISSNPDDYLYYFIRNDMSPEIETTEIISNLFETVSFAPTGIQGSKCSLNKTYKAIYVNMYGLIGTNDVNTAQQWLVDHAVQFDYKKTPTTETADPFTNPQEIDPNGSEEFVDNRSVAIPVGHESYYANICEIEGIDEITFNRTGVNLNSGLSEVTIQASSSSISPAITREYLKAGETYTFSCYQDTDMTSNMRNTLRINKVDNNSITWYENTTQNYHLLKGLHSLTVTIQESGEYDFLIWGHSLSDTTLYKNFQLEKGSQASEYHAYDGKSVTVEIGQEVYGGYYDNNLGIVLNKKLVDLGSLDYTYYGANLRFAAKINDGKPSGTAFGLDSAMSELYTLSTAQYNAIPDKSISVGSNYFSGITCAVVIHDEKYTSVSELKKLITGHKISYELATPIIIPADKVNLITVNGINNLMHDANGGTEVKFFRMISAS